MAAIHHPRPVSALETTPGARAVTSGVRTSAIVVSDTAEVMRANAAPAGFEGDPAEVSRHAMTTTAREADAAVAALQHGLAAFDAFCDRADVLRTERAELVERQVDLVATARELERRHAAVTEEDADPGLAHDVENHRQRVDVFHHDTEAWTRRVTEAEDRLIAALRVADSVSEGGRLALGAPDVPALVAVAESLATDPAAAHAWWLSLTRAQREALKVARPEVVGNLDGIPLADRDESNRAHLSALYRTLVDRQESGSLSDHERDLLAEVDAVHAALRKALDQSEIDGEPVPAFLMMFDPDAARGDGFGAVSFGNPETADHVSVNVPGFSSRLDSIGSVAEAAAAVRAHAARETSGSVASIAWLGYDAPDIDTSAGGLLEAVADGGGVARQAMAQAGAESLSRFVDGLRDNRLAAVHLTVIGHSYGSTTTGLAASGSMQADDIVLAGSPGAGVENDRESDLGGHVYVASADDDPITRFGGGHRPALGIDPASREFNATRIRADSQADMDFRGLQRDINLNHGSYFRDRETLLEQGADAPDAHALVNIARVVAGRPETVEQVPGRGSNAGWWSTFLAEAAVESGVETALRGGPIPAALSRLSPIPW